MEEIKEIYITETEYKAKAFECILELICESQAYKNQSENLEDMILGMAELQNKIFS